MKLEQVLIPIVFFVVLCFTAIIISTFFLRSRGIRIAPLTKGLQWSIAIVAIVLFSSLVIVSVYHMGTPGYIFVGVLFLCLGIVSGVFVYLRYRNQ